MVMEKNQISLKPKNEEETEDRGGDANVNDVEGAGEEETGEKRKGKKRKLM